MVGIDLGKTVCSLAGQEAEPALDRAGRDTWRMPPLHELPPGRLTPINRVWLIVLRAYLVLAGSLVLVRIVQLALGG